MAKKIVKYKMLANGKTPEWIENGGHFKSGHELLGVTCDEDCYWTPSNLDQQTRAQIKTWAKTLDIRNSADDGFLSDAETDTLVDDWLNDLGMGAYA